MSEQMICSHAYFCDDRPCFHKGTHISEGDCATTPRVCWKGVGGVKCVPIKPPKPTRKRSAPLYAELLTERTKLQMEVHDLKSKMTELDLRAFGLMHNYELLTKMSLCTLIKWWFKQRKGRA